MTSSVFPFVALVGLDTLKLALELSAIDHHLSVLVRGDKGTGKSTAARGLVELLPQGAPFVNLPIGATEDRLLGGLDVERTLAGEPALKPGIVARAHGGVLYADEVNLLADHLADALLDAAASGVLFVEREGFSVSQPAEFVLLGSMNPEEGTLRPQLLDRFALVVDVTAPMEPGIRAAVLDRRMAYDADPPEFRARWAVEQSALATRVAAARTRARTMVVSPEIVEYIATRIVQHGVKSLRADLAVVRASRAYAALLGADEVAPAHIDAVLPLALVHRMPPDVRPPMSSPGPRPPAPADTADGSQAKSEATSERVFPSAPQPTPRLVVGNTSSSRAGRSDVRGGIPSGLVITSRKNEDPLELDVRASVVHALSRDGLIRLESQDLHETVRAPRSSTRFILVVDSSGSHAVLDRMRLVKGVAGGLVDASHGRHDEIVVIACRGPRAEVLVEPTSSRDDVERALEYLPTGGRTPLAHGLELAAGYVTDHAVVIVITDGRANVPTRTEDAWDDVRVAANALRCASLVVDTEDAQGATGRPRELAGALRGQYVRMGELDPSQVLKVVREQR
ncbi:MAG: AAA domain-containing protein [Acidobacteria bacterium]|nr:AAA domain-containing protein [Acidobacteriota bacterium]